MIFYGIFQRKGKRSSYVIRRLIRHENGKSVWGMTDFPVFETKRAAENYLLDLKDSQPKYLFLYGFVGDCFTGTPVPFLKEHLESFL